MIANCFLITESCLLDANNQVTDGTSEFITYLCKRKIPFFILTNRTNLSCSQLAKKYNEMGIRSLKAEHFYTSTMAGCDLLKEQMPDRSVAGYIGTSPLKATLQDNGFSVDLDYADYVFVGTDMHATCNDYSYALRLLLGGALLLACDYQEVEYKNNVAMVGCGAVCRMLETASNKKALLLGMPNPNYVLQAIAKLGVEVSDCVFVGAHLEHEIVCGLHAKVTSVILTSAMHEEENLFQSKIKPDYAVETLLGLLR